MSEEHGGPGSAGSTALERRLRELECLNSLVLEIARADAAHPDDILELVTRRVREVIGVDESSIRLLAETDTSANPLMTLVRNVSARVSAQDFVLDQTITGWILKQRKPLVVQDLEGDPRFPGLHGRPQKVRSILAVPMMFQGTVYGILSACRRLPGSFEEDQVSLLATIATQSAELIEGVRLRKRASLAERAAERMEAELEVARRIQDALLPKSPPDVPGYSIAAVTRPALAVGGDYYDAFELPGGFVAVAVGDASGKGVPAAILISAVQATLRAELRAVSRAAGSSTKEFAMGEAIGFLNRNITEITAPATYATIFVAVLEPATGVITFVRAGHEAAMHIAAGGGVRALLDGGPPIGLLPEATFAPGGLELAPGESLVIFSDGVIEAARPDGEEFGEKRLASLAPELANLDARAMVNRVLAEVIAFPGGSNAGDPPAAADDITILVIRRETRIA